MKNVGRGSFTCYWPLKPFIYFEAMCQGELSHRYSSLHRFEPLRQVQAKEISSGRWNYRKPSTIVITDTTQQYHYIRISEFRPFACGIYQVICYSWAPRTGDHLIHMWRHLQATVMESRDVSRDPFSPVSVLVSVSNVSGLVSVSKVAVSTTSLPGSHTRPGNTYFRNSHLLGEFVVSTPT